MKEKALPNLPFVVQLAPEFVPEWSRPETSETVGPAPASKPNAATRLRRVRTSREFRVRTTLFNCLQLLCCSRPHIRLTLLIIRILHKGSAYYRMIREICRQADTSEKITDQVR